MEHLANNQDDLYILGQPPEDADVVAEAFQENMLVVIAPADHPLAKKKKISLKLLAKEPFLLREQGSGTRMAIERLFGESGLKIKCVWSLEATKRLNKQ